MKKTFRVLGFSFSGIASGIKESRSPDLALIYSEVPAVVVGSFTTNRVQAAPVLVSKKNIKSGLCRAVIVNSGNANACTGERGLKDAQMMVRETARVLKVPEKQVLVSSTGKIGLPLPIEKIVKKIPEVVKQLSPGGFLKSARAILTTDHSVKIAGTAGNSAGKGYQIVAFAKGAGMIAPQMAVAQKHATMLAYVCTDIAVTRETLEPIFARCIEKSFNRITVDGDTSTNDTALILANGLAGNEPIERGTGASEEFEWKLLEVMESLAKQMVIDGEGATKCVRIEVKGARNQDDAQKIAWTIANSPLVKTSFFGQDPNWGRLMGAAGRAGATLNPDRADIFYDRVCVMKRGISTGPLKDREAKKVMKKGEFQVTLDCGLGEGAYHVYTSDLTLDYVKINSCYRT